MIHKTINNKLLGFTLIELLVVIAIIGVLSTLAVIALGNVRMKSRDSKRMSDIRQIGLALDLYYADNNSYPTIITPGNSLTSPDGSKVYLAKIPSNPTPRNDNNAPDLDYVYSVDTSSSNPPTQYSLSTSIGTSVNNIPAGRISVSGSGGSSSSPWSCGDNLVDSRDNQSYTTVQIGSQCWMKQNINIGTMIPGANDQNDNSIIEKYCYDNTDSNCIVYGALYQWQEAMNLPGVCRTTDCSSLITTHHKGICPIGWHISTDTEFKNLEIYLDMTQEQANLTNYRGTDQGTKLKAGGISGFNALMSGARAINGTFAFMTTSGFFWQASQFNELNSWDRHLHHTTPTIDRSDRVKNMGSSVRCLKD